MLDSAARIPYRYPWLPFLITTLLALGGLSWLAWERAHTVFGNEAKMAAAMVENFLITSGKTAQELAITPSPSLAGVATHQREHGHVELMVVLEHTGSTWRIAQRLPSDARLEDAWREVLLRGERGDAPLSLLGRNGDGVWFRVVAGKGRELAILISDRSLRERLRSLPLSGLVVGQGAASLDYSFDAEPPSRLQHVLGLHESVSGGGLVLPLAISMKLGWRQFPFGWAGITVGGLVLLFYVIGRAQRYYAQRANMELLATSEDAAERVRLAENEKRHLLAQADRLRLFPLAMAGLNEGIAIISRDFRVRYANAAFVRMLIAEGQRGRGGENTSIATMLPVAVQKCVQDTQSFRSQLAMRGVDGLEMFVDLQLVPVHDDPQNPDPRAVRFFTLTIEDITERKRAADEAYLERMRLNVTLQGIADGVVVTDAAGAIRMMNNAAENIFEQEGQGVIGRPIDDQCRFVDDISNEVLIHPVLAALNNRRAAKIPPNAECVTDRGRRFAIEGTVTIITGADHRMLGAVMVFRDDTLHRKASRSLERKAYYDALTNLANYQYFKSEWNALFDKGSGSGDEHCVAYIDLDRFKQVNDTGGHGVGDRILQGVSAILAQHIRRNDMASRKGGDEFVIIFRHCGLDKAVSVCEGIRRAVNDFYVREGAHEYSVGASIGVLAFRLDALVDAESVLDTADRLLYDAKHGGRNRVVGKDIRELAAVVDAGAGA